MLYNAKLVKRIPVEECKMSNTRVKEGELYKYRNVMYGWKKYYFKLERSYLHYFQGKYNAEPKETIIRGDMAQVSFVSDYETNFGFDIHLKNGSIWYLKAATHKERMEWMRALQPGAYIVDPLEGHQPVVKEEAQPSAPPPDQQSFTTPNYQHIYPRLPGETSNTQQEGFGGQSAPHDYSPPPAYDEINYS